MSKTQPAPAGAEKILELMSDVEEGRKNSESLGRLVLASPRNLTDSLLLSIPQDVAKGFDPETRRSMEALLSQDQPVAEYAWAPPRADQPRRRAASRLVSLVGLAAAVIVGTLLSSFFWGGPQWQLHRTDVGQRKAVSLSDGTQLVLNTATELKVRITPDLREVNIVHGEARFDVHSEVKRPFVVEAGDVEVRALGTVFNVYRATAHTDVAVSNGAVSVSFIRPPLSAPKRSAKRLNSGSGIRYTHAGLESELSQSDFVNALEWESGRMHFLNETLSRIAEEFNRYNDEPRIDVQGEAAVMRYSGVFSTDDPAEFTALVAVDPAYEVFRQDTDTIIRLRRK